MKALLSLVIVILLIGGCRPGPESAKVDKRFTVKGTVEKIEANGNTLTIKHEEIPDFMPAMTMPFKVKNPKDAEGLQPGDEIWFRLLVSDDDYWIDQIKKGSEPSGAPVLPEKPEPGEEEGISNGDEARLPTDGSFRLVREVEPLAVGDLMPDYPFTNQVGKAVRLSDFKGKAVALTFIYTRCPIPTFCPRMVNHFEKTDQLLRKDSQAPDNWHLLTISFDVSHDTPAVLKHYASNQGIETGHWSFLTGKLIDIDAITEQFGLHFSRQGDDLNWDHNLRTVVIGPDGKIRNILIGNEWEPEELATQLKEAARSA